MKREVKAVCTHCEHRIRVGVTSCPACGVPTSWATHEQRTAWEVQQWRRHSGAPSSPVREAVTVPVTPPPPPHPAAAEPAAVSGPTPPEPPAVSGPTLPKPPAAPRPSLPEAPAVPGPNRAAAATSPLAALGVRAMGRDAAPFGANQPARRPLPFPPNAPPSEAPAVPATEAPVVPPSAARLEVGGTVSSPPHAGCCTEARREAETSAAPQSLHPDGKRPRRAPAVARDAAPPRSKARRGAGPAAKPKATAKKRSRDGAGTKRRGPTNQELLRQTVQLLVEMNGRIVGIETRMAYLEAETNGRLRRGLRLLRRSRWTEQRPESDRA